MPNTPTLAALAEDLASGRERYIGSAAMPEAASGLPSRFGPRTHGCWVSGLKARPYHPNNCEYNDGRCYRVRISDNSDNSINH